MRRRLRSAEIAPLHSGVGNKSETPSQNNNKKINKEIKQNINRNNHKSSKSFRRPRLMFSGSVSEDPGSPLVKERKGEGMCALVLPGQGAGITHLLSF